MSKDRKYSGGAGKTPFLFAFSFRVVLVVAAAALALSYISIYVNPSNSSVPLFFGLYFIPIVAVNLLLFFIALFNRSHSAWIPIIALLPSLLYVESIYKIASGNAAPQKEGIKLRVESYNVGMFSAGKEHASKDKCRDTVIGHIRDNDPHIVCLQEFFVESKRQADTIMSEYKYRYHHLFRVRNGKFFGNIILSKFPIVAGGKISFPKSTNLSVYADIDHFGRRVRVYNNHLESYNVSFTGFIKKLNSNPQREEITDEIIEVHEKMKGTFIRRSEQVNKIMQSIEESHLPAIICGDFNDTPMSYTYHRLSKGRKDSFVEAGAGFAGTYIPVWPLLRIDYILFPQDYEGVSHITHRVEFSDHYPVTAEFIL